MNSFSDFTFSYTNRDEKEAVAIQYIENNFNFLLALDESSYAIFKPSSLSMESYENKKLRKRDSFKNQHDWLQQVKFIYLVYKKVYYDIDLQKFLGVTKQIEN